MNFTAIFIRRPVATTLLMASLLLFGLAAYFRLPVSDLPNVDFPTIQVTANLPGASPDTMASAVATPLEKQFSTIAGIDSMNSTSGLGTTQIILQFNLDRDIDAAAQDVNSAIAQALRQLPDDIDTPTYRKVNPADSPILYLVLTSSTEPLSALDEIGQTLMAQNFSMVDGVAQVQIYGSQKYAVRIRLDPRKLAAMGIGLDQVAAAVRGANDNLPTGTLQGPHRAMTIESNGQLGDAAEFRNIDVTFRDGAPVKLADLGVVEDSVQNDKVAAWFVDTRAIVMAIQRQPGTNTVEVSTNVQKRLEQIREQIPGAVRVNLLYDRAQSIRESVRDVKLTLGIALLLVILVIFFFLRNVRATAIPSLALPMSLIGTFAVMAVLKFSLDNLSLMALTLSVAFVVDDAIVMLENIVRHLEMGKSGFQAALDGAAEIAFTIVSMTVSLVAVFLPLLFMGGIIGRLFHEFGVTIGVAILASGVISLTLTPMLASRFLRAPGQERHGRFYQMTERQWQSFLHLYERSLNWVMRHRWVMLVFSLVVLGATAYVFAIMPKGFLPSEDTGQIVAVTEAVEGISFAAMKGHQLEAMKIVAADPNIDGFMSAVGSGGPSSLGNQGRMFIHLKDRSQRSLSADQVIDELRPKLAGISGLKVYLQNPPPIRIGGMSSKAAYQYTLQSADTDILYATVPKLIARMQRETLFQDVTSDLALKNPQVMVEIDRAKAAALGVTAARVDEALYYAFGDRQVSTIYTPTNQYQVVMTLRPDDQREARDLESVYVSSANGGIVPLATLATFRDAVGPLAINHAGQIPSATISFNLAPGTSIGEGVAAIDELARRVVPSQVTTSFSGTAQAFQSSMGGMGLLLALAVLVIYIVLGILYESFIHPLTILTGLPFAILGALVTLLVFGEELNVYSFVGLIMLIGVVKKNAIMMIDFALDAERNEKLPPAEAIVKAASIRFRPIMMTTVAALLGTLPIALGLGAGAEARQPLGLAVVGGLALSQAITLYVTPVFYTYFDSFQTRVKRLWAKA